MRKLLTLFFIFTGTLAAQTQIGSGGPSGGGGGISNLQHYTIAKTCPDPTSVNVTCFVVADDVSIDNNPTFSSRSSTITTSTGAPVFKSTRKVYPATCKAPSPTCDVGKVIWGTSNCLAISPQNCFAAIPQGTITAITSSHVATISSTTILASVANRANVAWGTDDTAALRAAYDAHIQALNPSQLDVACGNMFFSGTLLKPSRVTRGPYAINIKGCAGNGTQLIPLPIFTQVGDGVGIYLQLNRECGQSNTFSCLDSAEDLTFYGLGLNTNPGGSTYSGPPESLASATIGTLIRNIVIQGILWSVVNSYTIYAHDCQGCVWNNNLSYAAGNYACHFSAPPGGGQPSSPVSGGFCNSSAFTACTIDGNGTVVFSNFECGYALGLNGGGDTNDVFGAGLNMTAGGLIDNASIFDGSIYMSGTSKATLHGTNLSKYSNSADGLHITSASNIVHLCNITATGAFTNWLTMTAAATVYDDCANTLGATTPSISGGGLYLMSPHTVGSDSQVAKAAAQTAKTLFTVGPSTALFRAHISVECTTTSASATVTPAILYTDTSNTAQTVTGAAATCTTLGANSVTSQDVTFRARTATAIQYQTTIANTPTYDVNVVVEQLTIN
jgi:hypothetical protein